MFQEALKFQSTSSIQRKTAEQAEKLPEGFISIHFLYTEEDPGHFGLISAFLIFQSTSSIQRKTSQLDKTENNGLISIHFLYTEEDRPAHRVSRYTDYFNPLPLYRGRLFSRLFASQESIFQSTSSIQRKTKITCGPVLLRQISIHFLYTEEDRKYQQMNILHQDILYLILTYKR
mgnify:CR=1 FL=1